MKTRLLLLALALSASSVALSQSTAHPAASLSPSSRDVSTPKAAGHADAPSEAQNLFNDVNDLIQQQYGGLSTVDRPALTAEYQLRLEAVCAPDPRSCAAEKAFPVLSAEVNALGDEHSFFETPEDFGDFVTSATGGNRLQFGVRLATLDGESRLVLDVIPGSASQDAGLMRGDVLKTIDGQPYTFAGLKAAKEAGKPTTLNLERLGQPVTVTLTSRESSSRDLPRLSYLPAPEGQSGQIALLRIPTFLSGGNVAQTVHDEVRAAQAKKAAGIIVDLRGNTGGDLSECDGSVSAFVPTFTRLAKLAQGSSRTVVRGGARLDDGRIRSSVQSPALWTGPLTVMVDSGSASCSEFFAYEMQYAKRATIIGEATAGVGNTATRVFPLGSGAGLQLTILNYTKPDGTPYPVRVKPDVSGSTDLTALSRGSDTLLSAAAQTIKTAPVLVAGNDTDTTTSN
ncbi:S41 family peptidase [Deinococcus psychrotolerans]|uniref:S41 family peptidase n=2 Tax=Deinococcus psychrotolerans TaxID=2489213 RepID=A0A3G8YIF1_9DEIO|nr:S41 family peptidase [Deinococcus psychrotolerans]AZI42294.1 S41 family peptidase [Deinococcus psychrotolerans]